MGQKTAAANFLISCFLADGGSKLSAGVRASSGAVGGGYAVRPARREFSESLSSQLHVPAGFRVNVFARGLTNPRMMAVAPDEVVALNDRDGDGSLLVAVDSNGINYRVSYGNGGR